MARSAGSPVTTASRQSSLRDRNRDRVEDLRRRLPEPPLPTGSHQLHGPSIPKGTRLLPRDRQKAGRPHLLVLEMSAYRSRLPLGGPTHPEQCLLAGLGNTLA